MSRLGDDDNVIRLPRWPLAESWHVYRCGNCMHAHVILLDAHDMPIAEMVIDATNLMTLVVDTAKVLEGGGDLLP
ncbi:MAG: hypothetical protein J2P55_00195 [Rhizobiales bacterium]|nr:hypothetical protein [Hyphomicrobiales bacterium]